VNDLAGLLWNMLPPGWHFLRFHAIFQGLAAWTQKSAAAALEKKEAG
jgi:hypothetical protein